MTCQQVQTNLSLFLYGDLDFATEEGLEEHLADCSACQLALQREKSWHASLNGEHADVPFELLSECRRDLKAATYSIAANHRSLNPEPWLRRFAAFFGVTTNRWSERLALASLCLFLGFATAHWTSRYSIFNPLNISGSATEASLLGNVQLRDVRPLGDGKVRLSLDQIRQGEMIGSLQDDQVRRLLLGAVRNSADAGLRVDSVEMLIGQSGDDVRSALVHSVMHDPNAAVRLKAIEGLRGFRNDEQTHSALVSVLQNDDNSGVRSEAIEVLVPSGSGVRLPSDVAGAFEQIIRTQQEEDYIRIRCLEILQSAGSGRVY